MQLIEKRPPNIQCCNFSACKSIQVTSDGYGISGHLVGILKSRGYCAKEVNTVAADADGVICLDALTDFSDVAQAIRINYRVFDQAKIAANNILDKSGFFVTVQNTGGNFALFNNCGLNVWTAGLTGLVKTLASEWPNAYLKAIDLEIHRETAQCLAQKICDELLLGGADIEVGLQSNGKRVALSEVEHLSSQKKIILEPNSVVIAVGGARGITAECLIALSKEIKIKVLLLGRTKYDSMAGDLHDTRNVTELKAHFFAEAKEKKQEITPKEISTKINDLLARREIFNTLATLKNNGAQAFYLSVDVQNRDQMCAAVKAVTKKWGNTDAIIYGAGVLSDNLLIHKTAEQFNRVFATKVDGLKNLLDATEKMPLKFIGLFSSIVGRFGNKGQSDYAMANEVLNKVACQLQLSRGNKCVVKAYNWGPWAGGMVTPEVKAHFERHNIALLPVAIGAQMFIDEMRVQDNQHAVEVILGDFKKPEFADKVSSWVYHVEISQKRFPFLRSHEINGSLVVPVCLVIEWFTQAVKNCAAEAGHTICREIRVLNGIRFDAAHDAFATTVSIKCQIVEKNAETTKIDLSLFDERGRKCYSGMIEKTAREMHVPKIAALDSTEAWPWSEEEIYRRKGLLFHGKDLQVIQQLSRLSPHGGSGYIAGCKQVGWDMDSYHYSIDVARYDGALQFLLLWGYLQFQKPSVPMHIGSFIEYKPLFECQQLYCEFTARVVSEFHVKSKVVLFSPQREIVAILDDVDTYAYNDSAIKGDIQGYDTSSIKYIDSPMLAKPCALAASAKRGFSSEQIQLFYQGQIHECFGLGFEYTQSHLKTPRVEDADSLLFGSVSVLQYPQDAKNRGYMRAKYDMDSDFIVQIKKKVQSAAVHLACFYLTAMGYTLDKDGWEFKVTRNFVSYSSVENIDALATEVVYDLFVDDVIAEPQPKLLAHVFASINNAKALHIYVEVCLEPRYLFDLSAHLKTNPARDPRAFTLNGYVFDYLSLLAFAFGDPRYILGDLFKDIAWTQRITRAPNPPLLLMTRVTDISAKKAQPKVGSKVRIEYDVPDNAWYFQEVGLSDMPLSVLLEIALQPCGWLAMFVGSIFKSTESLFFRNLDGISTIVENVVVRGKTIATEAELLKFVHLGNTIILSFQVKCFCDSVCFCEIRTSFGFFSKQAFATQKGIPVTDKQLAMFNTPGNCLIDLTIQPDQYFAGKLHLPKDNLLQLLTRITGCWQGGGIAGLGCIRAEKEILPSDWYFKAHFYQDPVQPGSLGIQMMFETLTCFLLHEEKTIDSIVDQPIFSMFYPHEMQWKYRGQVVPDNKLVTVIVEITKCVRSKYDNYVIANGTLWVDGKCIYGAENFGLRVVNQMIVGNEYIEDEVINRQTHAWLKDHCPMFIFPTLPMMYLLELANEMAVRCFPGKKVVMVEKLQLFQWLAVNPEIHLIKKLVVAAENCLEFSLFVKKSQKNILVAKAKLTMADSYGKFEGKKMEFANLRDSVSPYETGDLFHGETFQLLQHLKEGDKCSVSVLRASIPASVSCYLNHILLDAAIHGIPHSNLHDWDKNIATNAVAYPASIFHMHFYGELPKQGTVVVMAKMEGFHANSNYPMFRLHILVDNNVIAEMVALGKLFLLEGAFVSASKKDIKRFVRDKEYDPKIHVANFVSDHAIVTVQDIANNDLLPGTIAAVYDISGDYAAMLKPIAIKDFMARKLKVHPAKIKLLDDNHAYCVDDEATRYKINYELTENACRVMGVYEEQN